jgi:hypothetical protein
MRERTLRKKISWGKPNVKAVNKFQKKKKKQREKGYFTPTKNKLKNKTQIKREEGVSKPKPILQPWKELERTREEGVPNANR